MPRVSSFKFKRGIASFTSLDIVGAGSAIAVIFQSFATAFSPTSAHSAGGSVGTGVVVQNAFSSLPTWLGIVAFVVLILLCLRAYFEYERRTYDPDLASKFNERFDSERLRSERAAAANYILTNKGILGHDADFPNELNRILDFFDEVGYYVHGHQISPEVAHQYFYYWLRGFYQAAQDYIGRKHTTEKTTWEYVSELFELTSEIEEKKSKGRQIKTLSAEALTAFLEHQKACAVKSKWGLF